MLNARQLRQDFPVLHQEVQGKPLAYLDNAATAQKPLQVIHALQEYYLHHNSNVHRGIHSLAERATAAYEEARVKVARFIGAPDPHTVVWTRNATEGLNLVAHCWARPRLGPGDALLCTPMEHHSNIVPWQQVARQTGAELRFIPLGPDGRLILDDLPALLQGCKLVALTHASNVLGTINPVAEIARQARAAGAVVVVDGAQSAPHLPVDVTALGGDFFAFSAHKMCGPTGIGVLWGRRELLEQMEPLLFGGDMIAQVHLREATWNQIPYKFEAGTPNIADAIATGVAVDYLQAVGMEHIQAYEDYLVRYAWQRLGEIDGLVTYGPPPPRGGLIAFGLDRIHPHDVAQVLDAEGVAIRAGHHCAQPLMEWLKVPATNRASFYFYNTEADVDQLVAALHKTKEFFGHGA